MMNQSDNTSDGSMNANSSQSASNPHACITSTSENSHGYSSFDMNLILNYTNKQIIYYYTTGIISVANQIWFQQLMK